MSGLRAKDADRDRFVELIEAAYVDGQLSSEDRDLRVTRALSAATVSELEALTRDLQVAPAAAVVQQASAAPPSRPRRATGVLVGLIVFVALVVAGVTGVVALAMFAVSDEPDTVTSQGTDVVPVPIESSAEATPEAVEAFKMTPGQVRKVLQEYEAKFGTLDAYQAVFYPGRVSVEVPVRGTRPRYERWSYDGTWRQDAEATAIGPFYGIVDLGSFNVNRVFDNIDVARRTLNVQRGELTHVVVHQLLDDQPVVNIYFGNKFSENGYLMTSFGGDVVRSFPYDS